MYKKYFDLMESKMSIVIDSFAQGTRLAPEQPRLNQELKQGTKLDPEQPMPKQKLNQELKQGIGLDPERPLPKQESQDSKMIRNIMNINHNTATWPILPPSFWTSIEQNKGSNKLANAILAGINDDVIIDQGFPINLTGDYNKDTIDMLIRNTIKHFMDERLKAIRKKPLLSIDSGFCNLFVPDLCDSTKYLFGNSFPRSKKEGGFKEFNSWKKKYGFANGQVTAIGIQMKKMSNHLAEIDMFIDLISQNKVTDFDVREKIEKINIQHPYQLIYMVIMMIIQVKPANIPLIISYEIIIGLKWAITNCDTQVALYTYVFDAFTSKFTITPRDISLKYPQGITYPIIADSLQRKGDLVELLPCQVEMIDKLFRMVDQFTDFIINGEKPEFKQIIAIATGLATGKSTIASLIPTKMIAEFNKSAKSSKSGVIMFVMPSPKTAADFAVSAEKYGPTWIGRDGILIPMFSSCPQINTNNRKKPQIPDRFAENGGLNTRLPIIDQMQRLKDYTGDGKSDYKRNKYDLPTTMFVDPKTAALILESQELWYEKFGIHFLPIIDEVVATGDVDSEQNLYLDSIARIIKNISNFGVIISATLTERQLRQSSIFEENTDIQIVTGGQSCQSFTQIFSHTNESLHPLQGLDIANFDAFMQDVNSTLLRCISPIVYDGLVNAYKTISENTYPPLTYDDISSASNFLEASKRLLHAIHQYSKEDPIKCLEICRTKIRVSPIELSGRASTMTLTTGNPMQGILKMIPKRVTIAVLDAAFNHRGTDIKNQIHELQLKRSEVTRDKIRDLQAGSSDDIQTRIKDLEHTLKDQSSWSVTLTSNFGNVTVSRLWRDKYINMPPPLLALVLSGLELKFYDKYLDDAIAAVDPKPFVVIDSISGMFGRNVPTCARVNIIGSGIGFGTLWQAAARAGREKSNTAIVSLYIDPIVLSSDPNIHSIHRLEDSIRQLNDPSRSVDDDVEEISVQQDVEGSDLVVEEVSDLVVEAVSVQQDIEEGSDLVVEAVQVHQDEEEYSGSNPLDYARQVVGGERTFDMQKIGQSAVSVSHDTLSDEETIFLEADDRKCKKLTGAQRKAKKYDAKLAAGFARGEEGNKMYQKAKKSSMNKDATEFIPSWLK